MNEIITSIEDLKAVANKYGYNLIKKQKTERLLPCICGCTKRSHYYITKPGLRKGRGLVCKKCGLTAEGEASTVRKNWNDMIKRKKEEK